MTLPDTDAALTTGRVLAGRYRLMRAIARGGMAEVWEGHDDVLDRPIAVKILHPHLANDQDFLERFRREAIAAARLTHPNIVSTYDAGTDPGTEPDADPQVPAGPNATTSITIPYIVMQLVRGPTLRDVLQRETLDLSTTVRICMQVADALEHAHNSGLIHRDVKPANILLTEDGQGFYERAMVADFGIARANFALTQNDGRDLTRAGSLIGTAKYLAPEQVEGSPSDARTDVYALGVVMYEMLCGGPPFKGDTEMATALQHVRAVPKPPCSIRSNIPRSLEATTLKALSKSPADRFQTADELRTALSKFNENVDDNTALVDRQMATPPTGTPPVQQPPPQDRSRPQPTNKKRSRIGITLFLFLLVIVGAAIVVAAQQFGDGLWDLNPKSKSQTKRSPLQISHVASFDPEGSDGTENEAIASLAGDNNPNTKWTSDRYKNRQFGNLKTGVGLVFELNTSTDLTQIEVHSPANQWSGRVYMADTSNNPTQLGGWGEAIDTRTAINGNATFSLSGKRGNRVLIWITDPGTQLRAEITDVTLRS